MSARKHNKYRNCPLCNSSQSELILKSTKLKPKEASQVQVTDKHFGLHGDIIRCSNCAFVFVGDRSYVKKVVSLYKRMSDDIYLQEEKERRISFDKILTKINYILGPGKVRILDIGCCTGGLLVEAKRRNWLPYGIDPSEWACSVAKKIHNLKIFNGKVEDYPIRKNYYDAITLIDVLEHVENPKILIAKIYSQLHKGGVLCLVTPDYGSITSRILGNRWWGIRLAHVSYFDKKSLGNLMQGLNFKLIKKDSYTRYFTLYYIFIHFFPVLEKTHKIKSFLKKVTLPLLFFDSFEYYYTKV